MLQHTGQITAVEAVHIPGMRHLLPVLTVLALTPREIAELTGLHICPCVSSAEAIHIDLVNDRALHPLWHAKAGDQAKIKGRICFRDKPQPVEIPNGFAVCIFRILFFFTNLIVIRERFPKRGRYSLIEVKRPLFLLLTPHRRPLLPAAKAHLQEIALRCTQTKGDSLSFFRFCRSAEIPGLITEYHIPMEHNRTSKPRIKTGPQTLPD